MKTSRPSTLDFVKAGRDYRYKFSFLSNVLLLNAAITFGMGFLRWSVSPWIGLTDFLFAFFNLILFGALRRWPRHIESISVWMLALGLLLFLLLFLTASYTQSRFTLFFLFLPTAFFLKGRKQGRMWLALILGGILLGYNLPFFETGYTPVDVGITCLNLLALWFVLENYELFREAQRAIDEEQQILRMTEERLRHALEGAGDAVWDWKPETGEFHYSKRLPEMLGYEEDELGSEANHIFNLIHPEDVLRIQEELRAFFEHNNGHYVSEMRLVHKNGEACWLLCRGTVTRRDNKGRPAVMVGTFTDITLLKQHAKQLEHIAHYDALTGIPNRVLLADRLQQALAHSKRQGSILAVCYLDLDGFKLVNDTMGHEAGDRVLIEVTKRIKDSIRADDTVARLGGDEFAVLLLGLNASEEFTISLNRLLEAISQPIEIRGKLFEVSASIGVALYPQDDQDADTLLRHADQAMYTAKQSGKNRYYLYDAENDQRARSHQELLKRISQAIAHEEFVLYYQPKVDMRTMQLTGAEALIRWQHPEHGLLLPGEFLSAIEGTQLEIDLGDWVVGAALRQLEIWNAQGLTLELSINISARHLQAADFSWKLKRKMLKHAELPSGCLQVEVLETAALEDIPRVSDTILRCRQMGISFALDDFGTGYSSLAYLGRLPVDVLKIDQTFIRDMLQDSGDRAIVQGVIALAKAFDRQTVAEGVESEALFKALLDMGCGTAQGFGIARPMPANELPHWHARWQSAPFKG